VFFWRRLAAKPAYGVNEKLPSYSKSAGSYYSCGYFIRHPTRRRRSVKLFYIIIPPHRQPPSLALGVHYYENSFCASVCSSQIKTIEPLLFYACH
jgi:hypothetical protein